MKEQQKQIKTLHFITLCVLAFLIFSVSGCQNDSAELDQSSLNLDERIRQICETYKCPSRPEHQLNNLIVNPQNPQWIRYRDGSNYFLAGAGDPEDFLYRGERAENGVRINGDQDAIIDKLISTGVNGIYMQMIRSHGGDDIEENNHNPFIDGNPDNELSEDILAQWDGWFEKLDKNNITIFLFMYDDSARIWGKKGDGLTENEKLLIHKLVTRFKHLRNLVWVIAEEYEEAFSAEEVKEFAAHIKSFDEYEHPVAVHKLAHNPSFAEFAGSEEIDQYAIQLTTPFSEVYYHTIIELKKEMRQFGRRYNLNLAEGHGKIDQKIGKNNWKGEQGRKHAWAAAFAGAYVMVYEMDVINTPYSDLQDLYYLRTFFEALPLTKLQPDSSIRSGSTQYVLSDRNFFYALYAKEPGDLKLNKMFSAGVYEIFWFNPIDGTSITEKFHISESSLIKLKRPDVFGDEVAVTIRPHHGDDALPDNQDSP